MKVSNFVRYVLLVVFVLSGNVSAQWNSLSTPNTAVSISSGKEYTYDICSDQTGGTFIVWEDDRAGNNDIYMQRLNMGGYAQWTANGRNICVSSGHQHGPKIVADGSYNSITCWRDDRNGNEDLYAQKMDSSGNVQWTANGVLICNASNLQDKHQIISDGAGGAIIVWQDSRGANINVYAQRINSSGVVQWTANGVLICSATDDQVNPGLIMDGSNGAIIVWDDKRSANNDIYTQRINGSGVVQWTANGIALCTATDMQVTPVIVRDGSSGAIIAWADKRSSNFDIYAQRINSSGTPQWTANGIVISNATGDQTLPVIASDQNNGAHFVWMDLRGGSEDIYIQRVNSSGTVQFTANGKVVCNATSTQTRPSICEGQSGNVVVTWDDKRSGTEDIYVQLVELNGNMPSPANGTAVSTASAEQTIPFVVRSTGYDAWVIVWKDMRAGSENLYAQGLNQSIYAPIPVELLYLKATCGSRSFVNLNWATASEQNSTYFQIERSTNGQSFEKIGSVKAIGNSNIIVNYTLIDSFRSNNGDHFYRLKQIDLNGEISISPVVISKDCAHMVTVEIYPNPNCGKFSVSTDIVHIEIILLNLMGRTVFQMQSENLLDNIDVSHLPKGIYIMRVRVNDSWLNEKIALE